MLSKKRFTITSIFLAIMLCISLASVNSALADDGTPTEPAAATEAAAEVLDEDAVPSVEAAPPPAEPTSTPEPPQQTYTEAIAASERDSATEPVRQFAD